MGLFKYCLLFSIPVIILLLFRDRIVRLPAEWETQAAVWVSFRSRNSGSMFDSVTIPVIRKLSEHVKTYIFIENEALLPEGLAFFAEKGMDTSKLHLVSLPVPDFWVRDWSPLIIECTDGKSYCCNPGYTRNLDTPFVFYNQKVKSLPYPDPGMAEFKRMPVKRTFLVVEGGAIETNGAGTLLLVDSLILKTNPGFTKKQIEREFSRLMGIKTFIWMKYGLCQDPFGSEYLGDCFWASGTGGHTDHFARFANDSTVLLYWEYDTTSVPVAIRKLNHKRMSVNLQIIENTTDHRGRKFRVIKIPSPGIIFRTRAVNNDLLSGLAAFPAGSKPDSIKIVVCCSYLNYLITNKLLILPKYAEKVSDLPCETDETVRKIFSELYPEREIYRVNPMILNDYGGGLHCICRQLPEFKNDR
jgi:agmatine deiminase